MHVLIQDMHEDCQEVERSSNVTMYRHTHNELFVYRPVVILLLHVHACKYSTHPTISMDMRSKGSPPQGESQRDNQTHPWIDSGV